MISLISKTFQVLMDVAIGVAVYYGLKALVPILPDNAVVVVTLAATTIFAEFIEVRLKK